MDNLLRIVKTSLIALVGWGLIITLSLFIETSMSHKVAVAFENPQQRQTPTNQPTPRDTPTNAPTSTPTVPAYPPPATSTPPAYPVPSEQLSPVPAPTIEPSATRIYVETVLTVNTNIELPPTYQFIPPDDATQYPWNFTPQVLTYNGKLPIDPVLHAEQTNLPLGSLVDNWEKVASENFEAAFPQSPCVVQDTSPDGYERYWGADDGKPYTGLLGGWPAKGGIDGIDPSGTYSYPRNLDSWLVCGPFDLSQADKFYVEFANTLATRDTDDYFFFGVSTDGSNFSGTSWTGEIENTWIYHREHIQGVTGNSSVWVAWLFHSDGDTHRDDGSWLDDITVWRYNTPTVTCGSLDPGNKGVVLEPYDAPGVPTIRLDDVRALQGLIAADVKWVRLGFKHLNGFVEWQDYDRMIDSLCANGIAVLGLVNHETIDRTDFNDDASAAEYRVEFTSRVGFATNYFTNRVTHWEVWNEENYLNGAFVSPRLYAYLLNDTYQVIKNTNPNAQVIFGGLDSAWDNAFNYFVQVYQTLNNELGGVAPFNYFAVHPYTDGREPTGHGVEPEVYLHAVDFPYNTILDKFMETMADQGDDTKSVWVTEIGWNSSLGSPDAPPCLSHILVTEPDQATYLKTSFDILFNEVDYWNYPGLSAMKTVIWYQYMDVGLEEEDVCPPPTSSMGWKGNLSAGYFPQEPGVGVVDWWYGLYQGDKTGPKDAWCAFFAYPMLCEEVLTPHAFLPAVLKP